MIRRAIFYILADISQEKCEYEYRRELFLRFGIRLAQVESHGNASDSVIPLVLGSISRFLGVGFHSGQMKNWSRHFAAELTAAGTSGLYSLWSSCASHTSDLFAASRRSENCKDECCSKLGHLQRASIRRARELIAVSRCCQTTERD